MASSGAAQEDDTLAALLQIAREKKSLANAKHRQKKRAAQQAAQLEVRQVGRQVAAAAEERRRLVAENAALSGMALYQMGAVEALHSGALAQAIDGCMALAGDPLAQQQQQQQQQHHHHHQQEEQQQEQQLQGLMPGGYAYQQQQCAAPMLLDAPAGFSAAGGGSCSTCAATARPEALPLDALGWHSASGLAGELQHQPGAQQQQSGLQEQQAQQAQPHMKQEAGEQRQAGQQWWPHLGVQCGMSSDSEGLSAAAAAPAAGLQVRAGAAPDDTPSTLEWAATHVMVLKQQMEQQEAALRRGVAANDTASSAAGARGTSGTSGTLHAVRQLLGDRSMWASQFRPSAWHKRLFMRVVPVAVLSRRGAFFTKTLQRCVEQWEACPAMRPNLEKTITDRIASRVGCRPPYRVCRRCGRRHAPCLLLCVLRQCRRCCWHSKGSRACAAVAGWMAARLQLEILDLLAEMRPTDFVELVGACTCPPPREGAPPSPDGRPPLPAGLLPVAHYLEAALSPAALQVLEQHWRRYLEAAAAARRRFGDAVLQAQWCAGVHCAGWQQHAYDPLAGGSSTERAQAYCGTSSSLGCLASCTFGEMRAVVELQMSLGEVLTPIQHARALLAAEPYFPELTQLCPWLLAAPAPGSSSAGSGTWLRHGSSGSVMQGASSAAAGVSAAAAGAACDRGHIVG